MKRIVLLLLILFIVNANVIVAEPVEGAKRPKVGLVLCGGGAKGAAHVGALKVIEQAGVPIDIIVGTSIGGLVGGMYAMGYSAAELDSIISNCDWGYLLSDNTARRDVSFARKNMDAKYLIKIPFYTIRKEKKEKQVTDDSAMALLPGGFISGQNVLNFLNGLSVGYQDSMSFKDLPIPFACMATNLSTGQPEILSKGYLPLAMRATMAIPGVFAPVTIDGNVYVDGGVVDNFPVGVAKKMGADIIIGIDIQNDLAKPNELQSISQVLNQIMGLMGNDLYLENVEKTDILIKPDVSKFSTFSFNKTAIDSLVVNGYLAAQEKLPELSALAQKMKSYGFTHTKLKAPKAKEIVKDTFCFASIELNGVKVADAQWLKSILNIKENVKVSGEEINRAVSILMGTKAFSSVNYTLQNEGTDKEKLTFTLKRGPANVLAFGARFDSEEAAALLVHLGIHENDLFGSKLSLTGRLSYNPYGLLEYSYTPRKFPKIGVSYKITGIDMNIYKSSKNRNYLSFLRNEAIINLSNMYLRNFNFELGVKYNYFDFDENATNEFTNMLGLEVKDRGYLSYYVSAKMDSKDDMYFPNKGMHFDAEGSLCHTNFISNFSPFGAVSLTLNGAISLSESFTMLPSFFGRVIIGDCNEISYLNYVGGSESGRYINHQLPFIGINYADIVYHSVAIARLDLRQRIGDKHYVYAIANYLRSGPSVEDIVGQWGVGALGLGIKYAYSTPLGPLSINVHWSDYNHKVGAYLNFGYYF